MRRYALAFLTIILFFIVYFTNFFISKKREADGLFLLKKENQDLMAQIQKYEIANLKLGARSNEYFTAAIFSTYPFNLKSELTLNIGAKDGVKKGAAVLASREILIGQITEVFDDRSAAQTIFDPSLEMPVLIGKDQINGLLEGGSIPRITLIEKPVQIGDIVYSAGANFPYGLKIGEIEEIKEKTSGIFKEATLKTPFRISELREVNVSK